MCRGVEHVDEDAQRPLAEMLGAIARRLADEYGVPAGEVRIGPVDFGPDYACPSEIEIDM